jgi:hypothetical protein
MKLEFYRQILEKSSYIHFNKKSFQLEPSGSCGQTDTQTDRHDEADSHFSQFCDSA